MSPTGTFFFLLKFSYALTGGQSAATDTCLKPFSVQLSGSCLLVELKQAVNWCDAQQLCWLAGGELLTDLTVIRVGGGLETVGALFNMTAGWLWLGVTDLLNERFNNRSGWQLAGSASGGFMPKGEDFWRAESSEPNGDFNENCLAYSTDMARLNDVHCNAKFGFVCQRIPTASSGTDNKGGQFWRYTATETVVRPGTVTQYCFTQSSEPLSSPVECAAFAVSRQPPAKAIIHSRSIGQCRALMFTDALLNSSDITGATDWITMRPFR